MPPIAGDPSGAVRATGQETQRVVQDLTRVFQGLANNLTDMADQINGIIKGVQGIEPAAKSVKKASDELGKMSDAALELTGRLENIKGRVEKLGIEKGLDAKRVKDFIDEADKIEFLVEGLKDIRSLNLGTVWSSEKIQEFLDGVEKNKIELSDYGLTTEEVRKLNEGAWNEEAITKVSNAIRKAEEQIEQINTDLEVTEDNFKAFGKETKAQTFAKWTEGFGEIGKMAGALKGSPKYLMDQSKAAGMVAEKFKKISVTMAKSGKLGQVLGSLFKMMGGSVGGISRMLGGWGGLVAMAIVKVVDMAVQIDKFVKDANKAFASIRGPDIMTSDVAGQFKAFNDQIYSIRDNLRVGLDVDQVREFMLSVVQAGLQVESFNQGIHTYREAIYNAAKASRILGIDMQQAGTYMATMMNEFRMSLDDVDRAFVQIAFDAKKSGMVTDRFWNAISNASNGLALYGKFLDAASRSMKALTASQVVGTEEAAAVTQEMFQLFKKGSIGANATIAQFAKDAGLNVNQFFEDAAKKAQEEVEFLEGEIRVQLSAGASEEEITKLRKQMAAAQERQRQASAAAHMDSVEQAAHLAMISDKTPEMLMAIIKKITGVKDVSELTGNRLIVATQSLEAMTGVSADLVRTLIQEQNAATQELKNIYGVTGDEKEDADKFYTKLTKITKAQAKSLKAGFQKLESSLTDDELAQNMSAQTEIVRKMYGVDRNMARTVVKSAAADPEFNKALQDLIESTAEGDEEAARRAQKTLDGLLSSMHMGEKVAILDHKFNEKGQAEMDKMAKDTFDEIISQTLSIEDVAKITKDGTKWAAVSAIGITKAATGVNNIVRMMATKTGGLTPEEKKLYKTLELQTGRTKIKKGDLGGVYTSALEAQKEAKNQLEDVNKQLLEYQNLQEGDMEDREKIKKKELQQRKIDLERELRKQTDIVENTKKLIEGNDEIADAVMSTITADQKSTNTLISSIAESMPETTTKAELLEVLKARHIDVNAPTVKAAIKSVWKEGKKEGTLVMREAKEAQAMMSASTLPLKQGLKIPEMVTNPGAVVLHPRETILPADYANFKTRPLKEGAVSAITPPVSKNITITVNATETNLANKIANEIRAHLYREQLSGVA